MKTSFLILLICAVWGCRTRPIIGQYQQTDGWTYATLILKQDSSFNFGVGFCLGSIGYEGRWSSDGKYLSIVPKIPNGIHFDSITRKYVYDKKIEPILSPDTGFYIDKVVVRREILEDYSIRIFRIKHGRLYEQSLINGNVKYSSCPYFIIPTDSLERRRLQRKYQLKCSTLGPFRKLFIQLGILR